MVKIGIFGSNSFLIHNIKNMLTKKHAVKLIGRKNFDIKSSYSKQNIEKIIKNNNFDIIINAIGYTNIEKNEKYPLRANKVNVKITKYICNAITLSKKNIFFIHFSSDHLYSKKNESKEDSVQILNHYAKTKFESEKYAKKINSIILRTNFFGYSNHPKKLSFSDWIIDNLKNNRKINLYKDIYFSPLHFSTIGKVLLLIIRKKNSGIFNLGSKKGLSKYEFALEIAKIKNFDLNLIKPVNYNEKLNVIRPKDMRMNCKYFERSFNFKLPTLKNEIRKIK